MLKRPPRLLSARSRNTTPALTVAITAKAEVEVVAAPARNYGLSRRYGSSDSDTRVAALNANCDATYELTFDAGVRIDPLLAILKPHDDDAYRSSVKAGNEFTGAPR